MRYYVYILSSRSRNLYTGVTNNITRRVSEHREGRISGFTSRYRIHRLVTLSVTLMFGQPSREKEIKGWSRAKKIALITAGNAAWDDLAAAWFPALKKQSADSSLRSE
ncbi:MAG: GIY-YIG nuclease family protein [Acidobacteria bacterium]|nr:GIY-YIG nuclease family protein [Acidobacteriota bacterium]